MDTAGLCMGGYDRPAGQSFIIHNYRSGTRFHEVDKMCRSPYLDYGFALVTSDTFTPSKIFRKSGTQFVGASVVKFGPPTCRSLAPQLSHSLVCQQCNRTLARARRSRAFAWPEASTRTRHGCHWSTTLRRSIPTRTSPVPVRCLQARSSRRACNGLLRYLLALETTTLARSLSIL